MKKIVIFVLSVAALLVSATVYSQNQPVSFKSPELLSEIDNVVVTPPDMVQIMNEDASGEKNGEMYKVARILDVNLNMDNCGTTDILANGTKVWLTRGCVIDMFDFHWGVHHFPVFNVADSYITVAAVLLLVLGFFQKDGKGLRGES